MGWVGLTAASPAAQAATAGFTLTTAMTTSREYPQAALLADGRVLVTGGYGISTSEIYNPANATWSAAGAMTRARYLFSTVLLPNGQILAVGGDDLADGPRSAETYDPSMGMWMGTAALGLMGSGTLTRMADGRAIA
ncbi:MAG: Kelch domain protein, partial [Verrucomicrobiaceae bacterium]|nr:Kelch domain protein [Verrucomicrobiaceae bacterium]